MTTEKHLNTPLPPCPPLILAKGQELMHTKIKINKKTGITVMKIQLSQAKSLFFACVFLIMTSCSNSFESDHKAHVKEIRNTLLDSAKEAEALNKKEKKDCDAQISDLLVGESFNTTDTAPKIEHTYSINLNKAPADSFFATLADMYEQSIVLSPDIQGEITLHMKGVTIEEILIAVRRIYGFEFEKTAYGYNIFMPRLETRMFIIDRLDIERSGSSNMSVSSSSGSGSSGSSGGGTSGSSGSSNGGSSGGGGASVSTKVETNFWGNLQETIKAIISTESLASRMTRGRRGSTTEQKTGHVVINKDSGLVIVRAYPQQLRQVEAYIKKTQKTLQRQVIIEAKILDVELNEQHASGIDWNALGLTSIDNRPYNIQVNNGTSQFASMQHTGGKTLTLGLTKTKGKPFSAILNLLEGQGKLSILSSPRISTLNNQKAVIKVGKDSFFSTSASGSAAVTNGATEVASNVSLQSFFSGIALDVTPQISGDEQITLHIHPVITHVTKDPQTVKVGGKDTTLNAPTTRTRETDTIVRAKNGQVVIIGGLMESHFDLKDSAPPLTDKLGAVKDLLSHRDHQKANKELIILLKPIIVEEDTWEKELKKTAKNAFKDA